MLRNIVIAVLVAVLVLGIGLLGGAYWASHQITANAQVPSPTAVTLQCTDHQLNKGDEYTAPAGCNVKGDVEVKVNSQWVKLYTGEQKTGTILICTADCNVRAPFGANVTGRTLDDILDELYKEGCVNGCNQVNVFSFPSMTKEIRTSTPISVNPTAVPTSASPAPTSVSTTAPQPVVCDPSIPKGQWMLVPANCVVSGDVAVSDSKGGKKTVLYDSDQTTGLVVVIKAPTWVFAPYGASVTSADVNDVVDAVKATGCGLPDGCKTVTVVVWPK